MGRWAGALSTLLLAILMSGRLCAAQDAASSGANRPSRHPGVITDAHAASSEGRQRLSPPPPGCMDDSVRCRLSGICEGQDVGCVAGEHAGGGGGAGQAPADPLAHLTTDADRAAAVQAAARHAWDGYRSCAWGEDELQPLSCTGVHWLNLSLTMVDSLDTLHLLGMRHEFQEAATWLVQHLDVGAPAAVNLFETTIRILGGLLSAQALSADSHPALSQRLAAKAAELGARLMPAFDSPSGVPFSDVNLRTGQASMPAWGHISSLSEIASVSLEFTYLARITGHAAFERVPLAVHEQLERHAEDGGGLLGQYFNPLTGKAARKHGGTITLGARSDSYYEYLLKQWLLTGKSEEWLRQRYVQSMQSVRSRLLKRTAAPGRPGLWYVAEQLNGGELSGKMDHLVCFLPGLLALGDYHGLSTRLPASPQGSGPTPAATPAAGEGLPAGSGPGAALGQRQQPEQQRQPGQAGVTGADMPDMELAAELALTCYELYRRTPAGLAPEIAHFANNSELHDFPNRHVHDVGHGDFSIKPADAHNLLRPESVESFYLLWKVTGDPRYQHWAWQVFRALEKWAKVRAEDRHAQCATCRAQAAHDALLARQALEAAAAAAAAGAGEEPGPAALRHAAAAGRAAAVPGGGGSSEAACSSCSMAGGYSSLESVLGVPPARRDKMESFFLAETLKYLYLVFTEPPDRCLHASCQPGGAPARHGQRRAQLPLDRFVLTTEAHALPVVGPAGASLVPPRWQPARHLLHPFGEREPAGQGGCGGDGGSGATCGSREATTRQQQQQQQPVVTGAAAAAGQHQQQPNAHPGGTGDDAQREAEDLESQHVASRAENAAEL